MSERYHIFYKIKGSCYFHTVSSSLYGASKNLFINFTTTPFVTLAYEEALTHLVK